MIIFFEKLCFVKHCKQQMKPVLQNMHLIKTVQCCVSSNHCYSLNPEYFLVELFYPPRLDTLYDAKMGFNPETHNC